MVEGATDLPTSVTPEVGLVLAHTRRFSDDEIREYCLLSGHSADPLPEYLPPLLVVAPLTKLGGDLNYVSARMEWSSIRPVGRGEEITAELEITDLQPAEGMTKIRFAARILCAGELVAEGRSKGVILNS
jgi:hypothetical protein